MKPEPSKNKYVFKIYLKGNRRTWRTVALHGDHTLDDLHEMIYSAFDRYDEHLYSFYFPKAKMSNKPFSFPPKEYTSPNALSENNQFSNNRPDNASRIKIDRLKLKTGQTFEYLFDFGDMWWHEIKVLEIDSVDDKDKLPMIIEKHGESPEQYPPFDE